MTHSSRIGKGIQAGRRSPNQKIWLTKFVSMNKQRASDFQPLVYLCGSIGGRTLQDAVVWRQQATTLLAPEFNVINPLRDSQDLKQARDHSQIIEARETASEFTDAEVVERDLQDIRRCFLVLRHYLGPSEGSPMECAYAKMLNIPVVVSGIADSTAVSPWLRYHSVKILPSLEEAVAYVKRYWYPPLFHR
jgi:hypothetical protein